jgi:hypothetical protein
VDKVTRGLILLLAMLGLGIPAPGWTATVDQVVDAVIALYGGKEALGPVRSYRMEGKLLSLLEEGEAPFRRLFRRPADLAVVIDYASGPERRFLFGGKGWRRKQHGREEPVGGFLLDSMVLQAARSDLPWILDERRGSLTMTAARAGGKDYLLLAVPLKPGLSLTVTVDASSYLITASEGTMKTTPMGGTGFRTEYADFRRVQGILFPFAESNWASGQRTGNTAIQKVVLNPPVSDRDFQP